MCSTRHSQESLECYIDDVVICFEDFVKKSLIAITVGIGAVVLMMVYFLKVSRNERRTPLQISESVATSHPIEVENLGIDNVRNIDSNSFNQRNRRNANISQKGSKQTSPARTSVPNIEEKVLRNFGLTSCSQHNCPAIQQSESRRSIGNRLSIPSLTTAIPKRKLCTTCLPSNQKYKDKGSTLKTPSKTLTNKGSCCSMCCNDDLKR